jgi:squalene-associated FAD-dependent desaturase
MSAPAPAAASVAIVGGGLAGLAAGCALSEAGFRVRLFERRPYVGGRASSYEHPGTGEVVDNCQHVLLGCCTNLCQLYARIGATHLIRWCDELTFLEPGGRASMIGPSSLPAPFHTAPSFLRARALSLNDKLSIARAMLALLPRTPQDNGKPFINWLKSHGQTTGAIRHFWEPVLVSAVNEDLDRVSLNMAAMVFREGFLKSRAAGRMGLPRVPLSDLYSEAAAYIRARHGSLELRTAVESVCPEENGVRLCAAGNEVLSDYAVLAVPFHVIPKLLPRTPEAEALKACAAKFETSPITGIHLWFDREITQLDHAVLLDRTIQWMFNKSRILDTPEPNANCPERSADSLSHRGCHEGESATERVILSDRTLSLGGRERRISRAQPEGQHIELVVSSSKSLLEKSREEIIELAILELTEFFPEVRQAKLVKATIIKEVHATFSALPGIDAWRPGPRTAWPNVFLAGDWTATGWPATMEGAVRSGYAAAECTAAAQGRASRFLVPDLPAQGLMRVFS